VRKRQRKTEVWLVVPTTSGTRAHYFCFVLFQYNRTLLARWRRSGDGWTSSDFSCCPPSHRLPLPPPYFALPSIPPCPAISSIILRPFIMRPLARSLLGTLWCISSHASAIAVRRTNVCSRARGHSCARSRCIVIHLTTSTHCITTRRHRPIFTGAAASVALRICTARA